MRLLPIGKKLVNLDHVFSIVMEKTMIVFNSITGTYSTASKKDFEDNEEEFKTWKKALRRYLRKKVIK